MAEARFLPEIRETQLSDKLLPPLVLLPWLTHLHRRGLPEAVAPHPRQTNGQLERFHETLKAWLDLLAYISPAIGLAAMADIIHFDHHQRYQEEIGHVTPADVYDGRREAILRRRAPHSWPPPRDRRYQTRRSANPRTDGAALTNSWVKSG